MLILKLPPFFPHRIAKWKRAAISKHTFIWSLSSRSYIILALVPSLVSETNKRCASFELILKCPCVLFLYQTPS